MTAALSAPAGSAITLTHREFRVLEGMSHGRSNAEIGHEMGVPENSVKTYARALFKKLGARDRAHAVANGYRTGLLTVPSAEPEPEPDPAGLTPEQRRLWDEAETLAQCVLAGQSIWELRKHADQVLRAHAAALRAQAGGDG